MDDMDLGLAIDLAQDYAGRLAKAAKLAQLEADYAAREEALQAAVDALLLQKTTLADAIESMQAQVAALTKG